MSQTKAMNLYEFTNGLIGESYVRVYVWAHDEQEAQQLAAEKLPGTLQRRLLFASDSLPFCSEPSDSGFNDEGL